MSKLKKTAERETADAVLQLPTQIKIGERTFQVARPSLATLILVSKYISQIPLMEVKEGDEANIKEALYYAKDSEYIGDIVAILILGSKGLEARTERNFLRKTLVDPQKELAKYLLEEKNPKELFELTIELLKGMEVGFFLSTTIFLQGVNLLKTNR